MIQQCLPSLPLEILEEIVGFHGEKEAGKASSTLLSCLSTSRQFRVCALRHLCAEVSIPLDWPHRVKRLHDCIVPGGFGPFIKSIVINCSSRPRYYPSQIDEDIILPLLDIISHKISVRKLSLRGYDRLRRCEGIRHTFLWTALPDRTRHSLLSLSQVPTLDQLFFDGVRDFPTEIFSRHTSKLVTFQSSQESFEQPERLLNITSMSLNPARLRNIRLPNLRTFDTTHILSEEYDCGWKIIKDSCDTLESIRIRDTENYGLSVPIRFPQNIAISMFPRLEEFVYSYNGGGWDQTGHILFRVLPFFKTSGFASELRVLKLYLSLDGMPNDGTDDFWVGRSNTIATDPGWTDLDAILAKGHFPALTKVCISLSFSISTLTRLEMHLDDFIIARVADKEALKQEVEDGLSKSFSASLKASIPLEITVHMTF